ncbi:MAG: TrkH family potassium uptake protein [Eubacteriales bacterium]
MILNYRMISRILGWIMIILSVSMLPSLFISIYQHENTSIFGFIATIIPMLAIGFSITRIKAKSNLIRIRDGFAIVSFSWLIASMFGALPFVISGSIPSYIDALFETVSGFTTTGASILTDIEVMPNGLLFWRSFTHWLGGMGILVFAVALLPALGIGGQQIVNAETPGPVLDKITPKMSDMAKILYFIYIFITAMEVLFLCLAGMSLFDSLIQSFGTMGTGGFSNYNASIAHFNSVAIDIIIGLFMIFAGANFNLYYDLIKGRWKTVLKDDELRLYVLILLVAIICIALNLRLTYTYDSIFQALRHSFFQSASIMTTTGFASTNFDIWPSFSKMVLFLLMFIGGCSASTAGAIKVVRVLVIFKLIKRELFQKLHPRAVVAIKINNSPISPDKISSILSFVVLYLMLFIGGTLLLSIEDFGLVVSASAVAATLGNVGPGFEAVGPIMNYSIFSPFSKLVMSFLMLCGRLELFTVILLLSPGFWKSK